MYTQCPKCKSVFRVTETQLSARNGLVRCGQCQDVFNASWNLVDDVPTDVSGFREDQERTAAGGVLPPAPTAGESLVTGSPRAGGEQVELFDNDAAAGRSRAERRSELGARPGDADRSTRRLAPSAMPFSIVEDEVPDGVRPDRGGAGVEPASEGPTGQAGDDEEAAPGSEDGAATVADQQDADASGVEAQGVVENETPPEVVEPEARRGSGDAGGGSSLESGESSGSAADEDLSGFSLEEVAEDDSTGADDAYVTTDSPPGDAGPESSDYETELVTPEVPLALEPEDQDEPEAGGAAEPSLADLFAAAEESLEEEREDTADAHRADANRSMRDLFAIPDKKSSEETPDTAAVGAQVEAEPEQPLTPAGTAADAERKAAHRASGSSTPFDTPDAEEIVIEAPAMLWDAFQEEPPGGPSSDKGTWDNREAAEGGTAAMAAIAAANGTRTGPPRPQRSGGGGVESQQSAMAALGARLRQSRDMKLVPMKRRQPLKTAAWIVAAVVLVGVGLWQAKTYYLGALSQVAALRPYVAALCDVFSCTVPPRSAFNLIDLVGTSVNTHPETPGALRVSVNLVNRAEFEQAYPLLEITLSDKSGRIVGRRTYLPEDYLAEPSTLLVPKVIQEVDIDLAQPSENAVGYEIQLVAR